MIKKYLDRYEEELDFVHKNRTTIKRLLKENKSSKVITNDLRDKIIEAVKAEMSSGKSMYQICVENFGKMDKRFYFIYRIIRS